MYIDSNGDATYDSLEDMYDNVQRANDIVCRQETCLVTSQTWTNSSNDSCYSIEFHVVRNVRVCNSLSLVLHQLGLSVSCAQVRGHGLFNIAADVEARFEFGGKVDNPDGAHVGTCAGTFRYLLGLDSRPYLTELNPLNVVELLKLANGMDSKYTAIDVQTMIRYVSQMYFRNPKYVVPVGMRRYLEKFQGVPRYSLLKAD